MVTLIVTVGRHPRYRIIPVNFVVVRIDFPYNLLMGRPTLNALRAIYSTYHLSFKFPISADMAEVSSDVCIARECYLATLQAASASTSESKKPERLETGDDVKEIPLDLSIPERTIRIGTSLPLSLRDEMIGLLQEYQDVFAWTAEQGVGEVHIRVTSGKFLGYFVSHWDIKVNPDKALPFFKVLKKTDKFFWTEECQQAFEQMKRFLHHLPTFTSSQPRDKLFLYLSVVDELVSAVLIQKEGMQIYAQAEKLVLALVHAARKLKPYFLAHNVYLRTDQPFRQILSCFKAFEHFTKWTVELGKYDIYYESHYESRKAIKAQALADFLAEFTFDENKEVTPDSVEPQQWILHIDDSSNSKSSRTGLLLEDPQGELCSYVLRFDFFASNNETEYKAVIARLQLACNLGARHILVNSDSQLVICQIRGEYEVREEVMQRYLSRARQLIAYFESFEIQRIPRSQNKRADALSRLASTSFSTLNKTVLVEILTEPGYLEGTVCPVYPEDTWMGPLILFLGEGELLEDRTKAKKLQRKAPRYALRDNVLYKRSYLGPRLQCITAEDE
ncbi:uncharacterized protein [Coffea arabica]|uniref:RNase H type-1 domain-containing protein n=1 Tax=Coffea arabica TaxID=13443 RepID=A0ABM4VHP8_COFAR